METYIYFIYWFSSFSFWEPAQFHDKWTESAFKLAVRFLWIPIFVSIWETKVGSWTSYQSRDIAKNRRENLGTWNIIQYLFFIPWDLDSNSGNIYTRSAIFLFLSVLAIFITNPTRKHHGGLFTDWRVWWRGHLIVNFRPFLLLALGEVIYYSPLFWEINVSSSKETAPPDPHAMELDGKIGDEFDEDL